MSIVTASRPAATAPVTALRTPAAATSVTATSVIASSVTAAKPAPGRAARTLDAGVLARWGAGIAADGIAAHEDRARSVVAAASASGLCPVLVDVLADRAEPAVARERAFGRLAQALVASR